MPLTSLFRNKSPRTTADELLERINKWFIIPNPKMMTFTELKQAADRQSFLAALPGSQEFLKHLKADIEDALSKKTVDKNTVNSIASNFKIITELANSHFEHTGDMKRLEVFKKANPAQVKADSEMQRFYDRFKEITGRECVAQITEKAYRNKV